MSADVADALLAAGCLALAGVLLLRWRMDTASDDRMLSGCVLLIGAVAAEIIAACTFIAQHLAWTP